MSDVSKSRPFFVLAMTAVVSLLASVLALSPIAPASPAAAIADTMSIVGSQPTTLECCGKGIFGSGDGSHIYPYSYGGRINSMTVADNAISRIDSPTGNFAIAQTADRATAYIMSNAGFYTLNTNTGVRNFISVTDPDYPAENSNLVAADTGTYNDGATTYNAIVALDGGYETSGRTARVLVIKISDLSVEAYPLQSINSGGAPFLGYVSGGAIALDPDGSVYMSMDYYNSNREVVKVPTSTWSDPVMLNSGGNSVWASELLRGATAGTTDLIYGYSGKKAFYIDTDDDSVHYVIDYTTEAVTFKGLDEADNGDIYIAADLSGATQVIQLSKADSYADALISISDASENPIGMVYQKDSAGNECIYLHFNNVETVRAVAINSSDCGVFRSTRFSGENTVLDAYTSRTISIDLNFGGGVGDDEAWDSYAVFLDGRIFGEASGSIPSSITVDWEEYNTGIKLEVRGYTTGSRDTTAIADIDFATRYVDSFGFRLEYFPLAATSISTGLSHACAIALESVYCWGDDASGALGDEADGDSAVPVKVDTGTAGFTNTEVTAIATGDDFSCAVESGKAYCWGASGDGGLGDGLEQDSSTPVLVDDTDGFPNTNVTAIDAYYEHVCAIDSGSVYCWGYGTDGQLGNGSSSSSPTPVKVIPGSEGFTNTNVTDVSVGEYHTCAVEGGSVYCWGYNSEYQLGDESSSDSSEPVKVHDAPDGDGTFVNTLVTGVDVGGGTSCAIRAGAVYCWGNGDGGQLGNNSTNDYDFPVDVASQGGLTNTAVTEIAVGYADSCAVEGGSVFCWGYNNEGAHGNNTSDSSSVPTKAVDNLPSFTNSGLTALSQGEDTTCIIADGSAFCAGDGYDGELANGEFESDSKVFTPVFGGLAPNDGGGNDVIPGVTETDSTFYENRLPAQVAKLSSMKVLRPASLRTKKLVSKTTGVCLAGKNQVLYLKAGRCRIQIIKKSNKAVLKTLTTRVTNRTVSQIGKGNQAAMVKKVMFNWKSKNPKGMTPRKWRDLKTSVARTGLIFVVGHTRQGVGPSTKPKFSMARANVVKKKVTKRGLTIELFGMGGKYPIARGTAKRQQMKNERVMIYMIATRRAST